MKHKTKIKNRSTPRLPVILVLGVVVMLAVRCVQFDFDNPDDPANAGSINYGSLTDHRDNRTYRTVTIGTQTWMAQNLNFNASGSVCYDNLSSNCNTYGRLYDWATAMGLSSNCNSTSCASDVQDKRMGICPAGWHIPSDAEWTTLTDFVDSNAGTKLKAKSRWSGGNGTDEFGFSALPGGYRSGSSFLGVGTFGYWWSATEYDMTGAYYRYIYSGDSSVLEGNFGKTFGYSVRCVQDEHP